MVKTWRRQATGSAEGTGRSEAEDPPPASKRDRAPHAERETSPAERLTQGGVIRGRRASAPAWRIVMIEGVGCYYPPCRQMSP